MIVGFFLVPSRRKTVTDRRGGVTTYGYTPAGQVSALTDAENQVTTYTYNARGEKIRETYPDHTSGAAVPEGKPGPRESYS
jgi:YD repeat-containing protein